MYLCYIDESGTSGNNGNTSHFVLAGISIPIYHWKTCEKEINKIKSKYLLQDKEIHTGWILRDYNYQKNIKDFNNLTYHQRRLEVEKAYKVDILKIQKTRKAEAVKQAKKNYNKSIPYIHLTYDERKQFLKDIAITIGNWGFARLFAECINTLNFNPKLAGQTADEQAFEQVISRFQHYLEYESGETKEETVYGLLIHDNNETIEKKHTELMKKFHTNGTFWNKINNIIETPLFVDSQLTSMIQIADVCAYALRRYIENQETELFDEIFKRAHRKYGVSVGIRHYNIDSCSCIICENHTQGTTQAATQGAIL